MLFRSLGSLNLILIGLLVISLKQKTKPYCWLGETIDQIRYYVIFDRQLITFCTHNLMIEYHTANQQVYTRKDPKAVSERLANLIIHEMEHQEPLSFKELPSGYKLKYKTKTKLETTRITRKVTLAQNNLIQTVRDTIWKSSLGNSSLSTIREYHFKKDYPKLEELPKTLYDAIRYEIN